MSEAARADAAEAAVEKLFLTVEGRTDPYPLYHVLREAAPVHRARAGMWLLTRYADCWSMMRDPRFGKDYAGQIAQRFGPDWRRHPSLAAGEHSMLNTTGPEHMRLRRLVTRAFTPRMVVSLRPSVERTVAALLDPIVDAGGGNVLEAVGFPLPVSVIGEMLGVPAPDRAQFRGLVRDLVAIFEMTPSAEQLAAADAAQEMIGAYFLDLVREKRARPADDLLSSLAHAEVGGDRLTDDELVTMASLLFGAGFETTTNVFGNGLLALLRHPEEMALLRGDPGAFSGLVDELLRYDGTAQMVNRVTEAAVDIGGITIPAGEHVFALLGAGNRDPARYDHPDRLDLRRREVNPLTFGGGVHFCLGAALARLEIEIAFRALLERFDAIALASEPTFQDRLALRGLIALDVTCRPAARDARAMTSHDRDAAAPEGRAAAHRPPRASEGLRPGGGDEADLRWRRLLRTRIESEPGRADSVPVLTGARLAAAVDLLSRQPLFSRCARAELEELAATAYPMSFEAGDALCVEGAEAPEAYVVVSGQAVVTVGRRGVASVREDDVVGERGPLLGVARAATVTATTRMITLALSRERLQAMLEKNPQAREWMLAEMRRRYPVTERSTGE
jgi:cytochrome P450